MVSLLLVTVAMTVFTSTANECEISTESKYSLFKDKAEHLFLAYTENKIRSYSVTDPLVCPDKVVVGINATGEDTRIGGYWMVRFDLQDQVVTITPGK